jgi:putative transposase
VTREAVYGFIAAEKTTYPVRLLCRVLQVSASAFYDWIRRGRPTVSANDLDDAHAANVLHDAWAQHRRTYGARRLTAEIGDRGHGWNRKKVARLMTVAGIEGIHRRRHGKKRSRIGAGSLAPDLLQRDFTAEHPDQLWVADISYLRTWQGFLYLAVVIDACTRRVVGWAMADHLRRELVLDALGMALHQRTPAAGLIHHSDHGIQGGFNWSSQHLVITEVFDGSSAAGSRSGDASADEISWPSQVPARDRVRVLGRDRQGPAARAGCACRGRVTGCGLSLVPSRWRDATVRSEATHGPVLILS